MPNSESVNFYQAFKTDKIYFWDKIQIQNKHYFANIHDNICNIKNNTKSLLKKILVLLSRVFAKITKVFPWENETMKVNISIEK